MGNIGLTQGLRTLVRAFEASEAMERIHARLVLTGDGVAVPDVQREIRSHRVEMLGLVSEERLELELRSASIGLVSQIYSGTEVNLPHKLMNYMAYGIPVLAVVHPEGEVARLVREADAGWIVDNSRPDLFPAAIEQALAKPEEASRHGEAGHAYAREHFSPAGFSQRFDAVLKGLAEPHTIPRN